MGDSSAFTKEMNRQSQMDKAIKDLSKLFNQLSDIAEKQTDPVLKAQLESIAAQGQSKIEVLKLTAE